MAAGSIFSLADLSDDTSSGPASWSPSAWLALIRRHICSTAPFAHELFMFSRIATSSPGRRGHAVDCWHARRPQQPRLHGRRIACSASGGSGPQPSRPRDVLVRADSMTLSYTSEVRKDALRGLLAIFSSRQTSCSHFGRRAMALSTNAIVTVAGILLPASCKGMTTMRHLLFAGRGGHGCAVRGLDGAQLRVVHCAGPPRSVARRQRGGSSTAIQASVAVENVEALHELYLSSKEHFLWSCRVPDAVAQAGLLPHACAASVHRHRPSAVSAQRGITAGGPVRVAARAAVGAGAGAVRAGRLRGGRAAHGALGRAAGRRPAGAQQQRPAHPL